jgi:hypothetical protein
MSALERFEHKVVQVTPDEITEVLKQHQDWRFVAVTTTGAGGRGVLLFFTRAK